MIILKMGIAEFIYCPSIPVRVTINEYLEISKEYSTSKSSIFINGILDNLVREYSETDRLNKIGRDLLSEDNIFYFWQTKNPNKHVYYESIDRIDCRGSFILFLFL